jgi:hypothetical protein
MLLDWWVGQHYQDLRSPGYFTSPRDIALQLCYDGFQVTKRKHHSTTPVIAINLNLPPEIRYHKESILLMAVIPGPKSYSNVDSFLQPLVDELLDLQEGVRAYDASEAGDFILRAYPVLFAGDGPVVSVACGMKAPGNAKRPCRLCTFTGIMSPIYRHTYYPHTARFLTGNFGIHADLRQLVDDATTLGVKAMKEHGTRHYSISTRASQNG